MTVDNKAMGKRIKAARNKINMTQEALAEKVGVSVVHISNMESGTGNPSLSVLVSLINALGVSADEILCDSILHCKPVFQKEIQEITADCDEYETRLLAYILHAAKAGMKDDRKFREFMKEYEK